MPVTKYQTEESINYNNRNPDMLPSYINLAIAVVQDATTNYTKTSKELGELSRDLYDPEYEGSLDKINEKITEYKSEIDSIEKWFMTCSWLGLISSISGEKIVETLREQAKDYTPKRRRVGKAG